MTPERNARTPVQPGRTGAAHPGAVPAACSPAAGGSLEAIADDVVACRACPRLVEWREAVGRQKRRAYRDDVYWARPVPGFGDPKARLLVVGLAPAAHGANRTGRIFTGDRSGEWLYAALHRAGFSSRAVAERLGDGLVLTDAFITAAVKCAPPDNRPTIEERDRCHPFLLREISELRTLRVMLCLGAFAWDQGLRALRMRGLSLPRPRPRFGHGVIVRIANGPTVIGCYHPSQQNTFTGRLTREMLDHVFERVRAAIEGRTECQTTAAGGR